jgi:hypothetical protein
MMYIRYKNDLNDIRIDPRGILRENLSHKDTKHTKIH